MYVLLNPSFHFLTNMPVPKKGRIINITHQIPYEISYVDNKNWTFSPRRGHGAMYDGIHSLQNNWDILYIGWTGQINKLEKTFDDTFTKENILQLTDIQKTTLRSQLIQDYQCMPLFFDSESVSGHYDGYCKSSKNNIHTLIT